MCTNTFSVPEKQSFRSTYFGLTHVFTLPLGRCYFRRCYVIPLGGIVPSHRLSPSREEIFSTVAAPPAIKRKMSYHPCPVLLLVQGDGGVVPASRVYYTSPLNAAFLLAISRWIARSSFMFCSQYSQPARLSRCFAESVKSLRHFLIDSFPRFDVQHVVFIESLDSCSTTSLVVCISHIVTRPILEDIHEVIFRAPIIFADVSNLLGACLLSEEPTFYFLHYLSHNGI